MKDGAIRPERPFFASMMKPSNAIGSVWHANCAFPDTDIRRHPPRNHAMAQHQTNPNSTDQNQKNGQKSEDQKDPKVGQKPQGGMDDRKDGQKPIGDDKQGRQDQADQSKSGR